MLLAQSARRSVVTAAVCGLLLFTSFPAPALGATPPATSEPVFPAALDFPVGGGWQETNVTLDRSAHIREARLAMQGATIPRDVLYHVNATTKAAGTANAWSGGLPGAAPNQPPEAYIATPFGAANITDISSQDGSLATTAAQANYTYHLFILTVSQLDVIELKVRWAGYAFHPMSAIYSG